MTPPTATAADEMRLADWGMLAVPLLFAAVVWAPVLGCYFYGDDLLNLYYIVNKSLLEYLITPYGGHILPTRNAVFTLCFWLFGTDPVPYFLLVLANHLINVALLFLLIRALTDSPRLACFGATLWGTAPINEGTLAWYSVHGQVLATSLCLWVLYRLCGGGRPAGRRAPWGWALLLLAASTSFGVGIGLSLSLPLVALLLLPADRKRRHAVAVLTVTAVLIVALYFGLYGLSAYLYPYAGASRLGVLLGNLSRWPSIALLLLNLMGAGLQNLLLGPFGRPIGDGDPTSFALAAASSVLLLVVGARGSSATRRRLFAFLLVSASSYGMIAAGRIAFAADTAAFLRHGDRYHYLGMLPFAIMLCLLFAEVQRWWTLPRLARDGLLATWLAVVAVGLATVGPPIDVHEAARRITASTIAEMRGQIDAGPPGEAVYIENRPFRAVGPFLVNNPKVFPGWAAAFTVFFSDDIVDGRRVYFVDADPAVRAAAASGRRTAALLVAPEDARR